MKLLNKKYNRNPESQSKFAGEQYLLVNTLEIFEQACAVSFFASRLDLLKSGSLIWALDVFAITFRIYPKGSLILYCIAHNLI